MALLCTLNSIRSLEPLIEHRAVKLRCNYSTQQFILPFCQPPPSPFSAPFSLPFISLFSSTLLSSPPPPSSPLSLFLFLPSSIFFFSLPPHPLPPPHTSSGFGFVTFEHEEPAEKVCSIQYHDIKGKKVEVKVAQTKEALAMQQGRGRMLNQRNYGMCACVCV